MLIPEIGISAQLKSEKGIHGDEKARGMAGLRGGVREQENARERNCETATPGTKS